MIGEYLPVDPRWEFAKYFAPETEKKMSEEVSTEDETIDLETPASANVPIVEPPVVRKKRGRPARKDFKPIPVASPTIETREMKLLREELQQVKNQLTKAQNRWAPEAQSAQVEGPAFKGRPLPDPLPAGFPAIDPFAGDKTPAVVEWFRDNDPKEFEERYRGRKTHLRSSLKLPSPDFITDEDGRRVKLMQPTTDPFLNTTPRTYGG